MKRNIGGNTRAYRLVPESVGRVVYVPTNMTRATHIVYYGPPPRLIPRLHHMQRTLF